MFHQYQQSDTDKYMYTIKQCHLEIFDIKVFLKFPANN